jgi:hypothetical protein
MVTKYLLLAFFLFFSNLSTAIAQQRVEKLVVEDHRYENRGREIIISSSVQRNVSVELSNSSKTYTWSTGLVQKYDADYSLVGYKNADGNEVTISSESILNWKDKSIDLKSSRNVKSTFVSRLRECGKVSRDLTSTGREIAYEVLLNGQTNKISAVEIVLDGKWSAMCGTGKELLEFVYSPEFDLILRYKSLNFRPDNFLNSGQGWQVKEIILSK